MKWEDCFEARPSTNVRGENVFDIFRKGTEEMIYSDIPVNSIEAIKKQMSDLLDYVAREELEAVLTGEEPQTNTENPMTVTYERLRNFDGYASPIFEEEEE
jgi:hypothetical protein